MTTLVRRQMVRHGVAALASAVVLWWSPGRLLSTEGPRTPLAHPGTVDPAAPLLQRVRENLLQDEAIEQVYAFRIYRRSYDVSLLGKVTNGPERLFDVGPSPFDPDQSFRRLIAVDGAPLPADDMREAEEHHRREVLEERRARQRETPAEQARRLRDESKEAAEARQRLDDVVAVLRIDVVGREIVDGEPLLAVTLTPRPGARPRTNEGRNAQKIHGQAWVHEDEGQLAKIEVELVEDVKIGLGIIGRVHAGSRAFYRRVRLPDGTWAPVEARFAGSGRTLMLRPFQIETWARYSDYRRLPASDPRDAGTAARPPADRR